MLRQLHKDHNGTLRDWPGFAVGIKLLWQYLDSYGIRAYVHGGIPRQLLYAPHRPSNDIDCAIVCEDYYHANRCLRMMLDAIRGEHQAFTRAGKQFTIGDDACDMGATKIRLNDNSIFLPVDFRWWADVDATTRKTEDPNIRVNLDWLCMPIEAHGLGEVFYNCDDADPRDSGVVSPTHGATWHELKYGIYAWHPIICAGVADKDIWDLDGLNDAAAARIVDAWAGDWHDMHHVIKFIKRMLSSPILFEEYFNRTNCHGLASMLFGGVRRQLEVQDVLALPHEDKKMLVVELCRLIGARPAHANIILGQI